MADSKLFDPATIKKLLKDSNGKELSFAFLIGKSRTEHCFAVSKTQAAGRLFQEAKKTSGLLKGAQGTVVLNGRDLTLTCEKGAAGAALSKAVEQWLKAETLQYSVIITEAGSAGAADAAEDDDGRPAASKKATDAEDEDVDDDAAADDDDDDDESRNADLFEAAYLKRMLRQARKEPRPFAFGLGKARENDRLAIHRRRTGKRLFKIVHQETGMRKGTWGLLSVDGKTITFRCERKPLPGMKRLVKLYFRTQGLPPLKIQIFGPGGEALDEDDDDLSPEALSAAAAAAARADDIDDDEDEGAPEAAAAPAADTTPLSAELRDLMPALKARAAEDEAARKDLSTLFAAFKTAIAAADTAEAERLLVRFRAYAMQKEAAAEGGAAAEPDAAPAKSTDDAGTAALRKRLGPIGKAVPAVSEAFPGRRDELESLTQEITRALDNGDEASAQAAMAVLEQLGSALWQERRTLRENKAAAKTRLDETRDGVDAALDVFVADREDIQTQAARAEDLLDFDLVDDALEEIAGLEQVAYLATAEPEDAREFLIDQYTALWSSLVAIREIRPALSESLEAGRTAFFNSLDDNDWMSARKALDALKDLAVLNRDDAQDAADGAVDAEIAATLADLNARFKTAEQQWGVARKSLKRDMDALRVAIMQGEGEDPDIDWIRVQADDLIDGVLSEYDESLEALMAVAVNENDPERKDSYRQQALELIARHRAFADENFIMTNVGANDYVKLGTRETVVSTLNKMEALLG